MLLVDYKYLKLKFESIYEQNKNTEDTSKLTLQSTGSASYIFSYRSTLVRDFDIGGYDMYLDQIQLRFLHFSIALGAECT